MATIEKRTIIKATKNGKEKKTETHYRAKIRLKGFPPETATFTRKTDADEWAKKTEWEMKNGRYFGQSKRHTLSELIKSYQSSLAYKNLSGVKDVKRRLLWWNTHYGYLLLSDLTRDIVAKGRDQLKSTPKQRCGGARSGADVNRTLAALSSVCSYGISELDWLGINPCENVKRFKESKGRTRYLDEEELPKLLNTCRASKNEDLYLAVLLAIITGGRQTETMGMKWSQINFNKSIAILGNNSNGNTIQEIGGTKNGDTRAVPLSGELNTLLKERAKVRQLTDNRIFPPTRNAKKAPYRNLYKAWSGARKEAQIEDFRWHDLRHSCASYLAMAGVSLLEIGKYLGHRSANMVLRYAHLSNQHLVKLGDTVAKHCDRE